MKKVNILLIALLFIALCISVLGQTKNIPFLITDSILK
jgi:hypothetical protein